MHRAANGRARIAEVFNISLEFLLVQDRRALCQTVDITALYQGTTSVVPQSVIKMEGVILSEAKNPEGDGGND
ncbi:MAG: hypothetical protein ACYDBH_10585, partial [Acidobacteriaceae bacterium]